MKKLLALITLLTAGICAFAQDPHFSQFFSSPLTLNPAYTGKFDGTFRVAGNYRNQWPTINNAFTTATASVDFDIIQNKLPEFDTWGVGIMGMNDQSGDKILTNNFISLSTAYHKGLDENGYHTLTVGFQGTYANKRLDISKATFEDMLRADGFTGTTREDFSNNTSNIALNYFDVNAGLLYSGTTNGYNNFYLGVSTYHINRSKESFKGGNYILNPRLTVHGGGYAPIGRITTLHASFIYQQQAGASETVLGGAVAFKLNEDDNSNETNLYTGLWYRFKDAFIPYIGLEFAGLRLGYSYDVNNSSLNTASNSRGGNEISLIYVRKASDPNRRKLGCPKF